jgi:hypothetical protein
MIAAMTKQTQAVEIHASVAGPNLYRGHGFHSWPAQYPRSTHMPRTSHDHHVIADFPITLGDVPLRGSGELRRLLAHLLVTLLLAVCVGALGGLMFVGTPSAPADGGAPRIPAVAWPTATNLAGNLQ